MTRKVGIRNWESEKNDGRNLAAPYIDFNWNVKFESQKFTIPIIII